MNYRFDVEFLDEAVDFIDRIPKKDREKILYNIWRSRYVHDPELFKKLTDEIWEFRTLYNGIQYRTFAFWHPGKKSRTLVICTHCIIKKTRKTPLKEIRKAETLRNNYIQNP